MAQKNNFFKGTAGAAEERTSAESGEEKSASKGKRKGIQRSKSKTGKSRSSQKGRNEKVRFLIYHFLETFFAGIEKIR